MAVRRLAVVAWMVVAWTMVSFACVAAENVTVHVQARTMRSGSAAVNSGKPNFEKPDVAEFRTEATEARPWRQRIAADEFQRDFTSVHPPQAFRAFLQQVDNTPGTNPLTDAGANLGRALFYDVGLSGSGATSCASCHQQRHAFTDGVARSVGHTGQTVRRNSMPLVNLRYTPGDEFFWDGRARTLEAQVIEPLLDPIEMGGTIDAVIDRVESHPDYRRLWNDAFGDARVDRDGIAKSLAQFVRSITSFDSRYDRGRRSVDSAQQPFPNFTAQENEGKRIFFSFSCADCHLPEVNGERQDILFQTVDWINNGLDIASEDVDPGRREVSGRASDEGRFRASSLRNIMQTAPYMHDGRFVSVLQVIEHYNWSVKPTDNLDPRLRDFSDNGMALPEIEKDALVAFLHTLTDRSLLSDARWADPWRSVSDANLSTASSSPPSIAPSGHAVDPSGIATNQSARATRATSSSEVTPR